MAPSDKLAREIGELRAEFARVAAAIQAQNALIQDFRTQDQQAQREQRHDTRERERDQSGLVRTLVAGILALAGANVSAVSGAPYYVSLGIGAAVGVLGFLAQSARKGG